MKKQNIFLRKLSGYSLCVLIVFWGGGSAAQNINYFDSSDKPGFTIQKENISGITIRYSVNEFQFDKIKIDGREMVNVQLPGHFLPNNKGAPNLPGAGRYIAVPQEAIVSYSIISEKIKTYRNIELAPAPKIPKETEDGPLEYTFDSTIYKRNAFYPEEPVIISSPQKIRGVDVVIIGVTPFQYNPVTKELIVYHDLKIDVNFEGGSGRAGDDRLRNQWWDPVLKNMVLNHKSLPAIDYSQRIGSRTSGYDYIIVTPDDPSFLSWADSLRIFRIEQGISTKITTLTEIGGNDEDLIEDYIDNAYNNWSNPPVAILLLGDYGTSGNTIVSPVWNNYCISDNIYADVDGDDLPDIYLARITAQDETDLANMIGKILSYERQPPTDANFYQYPVVAGGWQTERWFTLNTEVIHGFWENEMGKDPVREYAIYSGTPGSVWSTNPNTQTVVDYFGPGGLEYIPGDPSYLTDWGGNASRINNDLNNGAFMIVHRDHGLELGWGEPYYRNSSLALLNNDYLPFVFSLNCLTGKFNYSNECFTEAFHRMEKGALGVTAASEISYSFVNDVYAWGMWDNMWSEFDPGYGITNPYDDILPCIANVYGKYYLAPSSWPYNPEHKVYTYHLFHHHGDAFSTVYSEVPDDLTIACIDSLLVGSTFFTVTADLYSTISLTCDTNILGVATGTGSPVQIVIPGLLPPDTMIVTVTKQNYFRYQKKIPVVPPDGPFVVYHSDSVNDVSQSFPNGELDYGESVLLTLGLKNYGNEAANNINAVLRTNDPYITIEDSTGSYGNMVPDALVSKVDEFAFSVSDYVPDGHIINFEVDAVADNRTTNWISNFSKQANAPKYSQSPDTLVYGGVLVGDSLAYYCRVRNNGHCHLSGTIYTPGNYYINSSANDSLAYSLNPGESQNFWLRYIPDQIAINNDSVLIISNDPNQPENYIYVFGEGIVNQPTDLSAALNVFSGEVSLEWNFDTIPGFDEDFEDGVADNFLFNDPGISVSDGYLKMTGPFQTAYPCAMYNEDFYSFELEASVKKMGGSEYSYFGLFIRANGFKYTGYEGGYTFEITADGRYRIANFYSGTQYVINWDFTNTINEGLGATNVLRVTVSNNIYIFSINGYYVYSFTDSIHPDPGKINLYANNSTGEELWWDYVTLSPYNSRSGNGNERLAGTFQHFNIYRDEVLIESATTKNFSEVLAAYGTYNYKVKAVYDLGESYPAGPEQIYWNGYPVISVAPDSLFADLESGEVDDEQNMTINNSGDSTLIYKIDVTDSTQSRSVWDLQFSYPVEIGEGEGGCETDGSFLYTSKLNSDVFFKYTMDGNFAGSFTIPNCEQIWDMAWDGQYFYGSYASNTGASYNICIMDFETQTMAGTFYAPCRARAIAYNDDLDAFYANDINSDITLFDRNGNILNTFPVGSGRAYTGLAYDNYSAGGPYLWGFGQDCGGGTLVQMDASTGIETGATFDVVNDLGSTSYAGGLYIHPNIVGGKVTIGGIMIDDLLFGYELCDYTVNSWIIPDPVFGTVSGTRAPANIDITFDATGLIGGDYYGNVRISSNDPVESILYVPAHLKVTGIPDISLNFEYDSTSLKYWTDSDTVTYHSFSPLFYAESEVVLAVSIDGDFNSTEEYADVFLDDSLIARINPVYNITTTQIFILQQNVINSLIDSGSVNVTIINSPAVNSGYGEDFHMVDLTFLGPEPDTIWFNEVIVGDTCKKDFLISNVGTDLLTISNIESSNNVFSVDTTSFTLDPDSNFLLEITFAPDDYISEEGILTITSDDPDEPVIEIPMTGIGIYSPEINVVPDYLSANLLIGYTSQQTLQVLNSGLSDLFVNISHEYEESLDSIYYDDGSRYGDVYVGYYPSNKVAVLFDVEDIFTLNHIMVRCQSSSYAIIRVKKGSSYGPTLFYKTFYPSSIPKFIKISLTDPLTFYSGEQFWIEISYSSISATQAMDYNVTGAEGHNYHWSYSGWTSAGDDAYLIRAIMDEDLNWLSIDPLSATIPPSTQDTFDVLFDATNLVCKTYNADIIIDHNDINNPQVIIPVELNAIGTPEIVVFTDSLHFDTTFVDYTSVETFNIKNQGTDTLNVSDIISGLSDFVADTTSFALAPGETIIIEVNFTPEIIGQQSSILSIYSDDLSDPVVVVSLTGVGIYPPVINVNPVSIADTIPIWESSSKTLNIANTGLSDLDISISFTYIDSTALAPLMANSAPEIINPVVVPNGTIKEMESTVAPSTNTIIQPSWGGRLVSDSIYYDDGDNYRDSFVGTGSSTTPYSTAMKFTPLRDLTLTHVRVYYRTENVYSWLKPNMEIYYGGNTPDQGILIHQQQCTGTSSTGQFFYVPLDQYFIFNEGEEFWIVMHYHSTIKWPQGTDDYGFDCENRCYSSIDEGASWQMIGDILGDGRPDAWIIRAIDDTQMNWLSVDPLTETIPLSNDYDFNIDFDASALIPGVFTAQIDVSSNDPVTPLISVPVSLTVQGIPSMWIYEDSLNFGTSFVGYPAMDSLTIRNIGNDTLSVTNIVSNQPDFSANTTSFNVEPGDIHALYVSFTPASTGLISGELLIYSNDPNNPVDTIPVKGTGVDPPIVNVAPAALFEELYQSDTSTQSFLVSNTGGSDLDLNISIDFLNRGSRDINDSIYYDDGNDDSDAFWGLNGSGYLTTATKFTTSDQFTLTHIRTYYRTKSCMLPVTIEIYSGGAMPDEGTLLHSQSYDGLSPEGQFFYIPMSHIHTFGPGQDFWVLINFDISINYAQGCDDNGGQQRTYYKNTLDPNWTYVNDWSWVIRAIDNLEWVYVNPVAATIPQSSDHYFDVKYNAAVLGVDIYEANILINNNDPATPQIIIPVELTVNGIANLVVGQDSLSFDTTFVGYQLTDSLMLTNTGTDSLFVSNITCDLVDFTVDTTSFCLLPDDSLLLIVCFSPQSDGIKNGILSINSNDYFEPVKSVTVSGIGVNPPVMNIAQDSIYAYLFANDTSQQFLTVMNTGGYDLDVGVAIEYLYRGSSYGNRIIVDSLYYDDGDGTEDDFVGYNGSNPMSTATRFSPADDFILTHTRVLYRTENSVEPVTIEIILGGITPDLGTSIHSQSYNGLSNDGSFFYIPLDQSFSFDAGEDFWIVMHYDISVNYPQGTDDSGGDEQQRDYYSGDGGNTWYALGDILGDGSPDAWIIRAISDLDWDWLSVDPLSSTILPSGLFDFDVIFDATTLNVGSYNADIIVNGNDPANLFDTIPVTLYVLDTNAINISGEITDNRAGIPGVLIGGVFSDTSGAYSVNFPNGWSGTLSPVKNSYVFTPPSRTYTNITTDISGQNYTGSDQMNYVLTIPGGWSGISSYVDPNDSLVENIFAPVISDLVILQNNSGGLLWPGQGINTIINWNSHQGYKIKMDAQAQVTFYGYMEDNRTVDLNAGWSMIPVLNENSVSTENLFLPIGDTLVIVKEIGGGLMYWPDQNIETLENLIPGKGYQISVQHPCSITYPERGSGGNNADLVLSNIPPWNDIFITATSHVIALNSNIFNTLYPQDLIGVFTREGVCSGIIEIPGDRKAIAITTFADDNTTVGLKEGFTEDEALSFRLFRLQTNEEYLMEVTYDQTLPDHSGVFVSNGLSAITDIVLSPYSIENYLALESVIIYPNPAHDRLYFKYKHGVFLRIKLVNTYGDVVLKTKVESSSFVNTDLLPSGIYFVEISLWDQQEKLTWRKVVINR